MIKVGILGAGGIAATMASTLARMDDARAWAVAARDGERARAFAREHGVARAYGDYLSLVTDPEVELIYVATPHALHAEHARLCLEHGKPVLCEKPFTANAEQAEALLQLARARGVFIGEALWVNYMPSRSLLREIIASGAIGEVVSLTASLGYDLRQVARLADPALAGGALLDLGIYPLAFAQNVLGTDVVEVMSTCTLTERGVDERNAIFLKYRRGTTALLHSTWLAATEQQGIVHGTEGYLVAEPINNLQRLVRYGPDRRPLETWDVPAQITGFEYQIRAVRDALRAGQLECAEVSHEDILQRLRLMDRLRRQWGLCYPFEA